VLSSLLLAAALSTTPHAGLVGATCEQGGTQVSLAAPAAQVATFTVAVAGEVRWYVTLGAGQSVDIPLSLPEGESRVEIHAPGMPVVAATVDFDCRGPVFTTQPVELGADRFDRHPQG
jgi:hypothetical protein